MNAPFREIVIWAHSECRSNMSLYREVVRQASIPITIALWKHGNCDDVRTLRESQGQQLGEYDDIGAIPVGDDLAKGRELLAAHGGPNTAQVFCVYQNSSVWRQLILEAKRGGARVIVSAEAPCPMCTDVKAMIKRLYYRFFLPLKVREVAATADLFLNASGESGVKELLRLGWAREKIIPFGYASAVPHFLSAADTPRKPAVGVEPKSPAPLHILHTGQETPYRGVRTLLRATEILRRAGIPFELIRTGGSTPSAEMARLFSWADVFVACGVCEPWGIRVNDAIHAGIPVVISAGMGAAWLVDCFGCGAVFRPGNARELANILARFTTDPDFVARSRAGVAVAHDAWTPEARAKVWLEAVVGK